ncbi:hypothetical protein ABZP36_033986 [Zizania latifolia]
MRRWRGFRCLLADGRRGGRRGVDGQVMPAEGDASTTGDERRGRCFGGRGREARRRDVSAAQNPPPPLRRHHADPTAAAAPPPPPPRRYPPLPFTRDEQ